MQHWTNAEKNKTADSSAGFGLLSIIGTHQSAPSSRHKFKGLAVVVDDQSTGRKILTELLQQMSIPLQVKCFSDPLEALQFIHKEPPDLILTDYKMPNMDGIEFTNQVRSIKECMDVPLVVFTVCEDRAIRYKALEAGASDFIARPIDQYECQARFKNLIAFRRQQLMNKSKADWLENQVLLAAEQVKNNEQEMLFQLARLGDYRGDRTGGHVMRVARFSRLIAESLGMHESDCYDVELAASLHDVGKVGIPEQILLKAGTLNEQELNIVRRHTSLGYELLKDSSSRFMGLGAIIALNHHERYDGGGYPSGKFGEDIPLPARIVAVADVFDVLLSDRPYRQAWRFDRAVEYMLEQSGKQFDPNCIQAFVSSQAKIKEISKNEWPYK